MALTLRVLCDVQVGCWALTEPSNGSDASGLTATAKKVPGGWVGARARPPTPKP